MSAINKSIVSKFFGIDKDPVKIRENCKTEFYVKKNEALYFKEGGYGSITEVCKKSNCKYISKIIPLSVPSVKKSFMREAIIAPVLGELGLAPKVYDVFTCLNAGFIIMEKWEGSLGTFLDKEKKITDGQLEEIGILIEKVHRAGIIHNDLHTGNILYRTKNNKVEFCVTDFGLSLRFNNANEVLEKSMVPNNVSPNIYFPAFDYHRIGSAIESRLNKIFESYFIDKDYLTLLEYVLVERFWWRDNKHDKINFLEYLQGQKLAKNMIRTLPRNPTEMFLPLSTDKSKSLKKVNKKKKLTRGTKKSSTKTIIKKPKTSRTISKIVKKLQNNGRKKK